MRVDNKLKKPAERLSLVEELLEDNMITQAQASFLADYLLFVADPCQTAKEKVAEYPVVTRNRDATVSKRQVSFEETVESLTNGEDGIYSMIINDKDALLDMRETITEEDKANIPGIAENLAVIDTLKAQLKQATGRRKYLLKCQIISKYQELYTTKSSHINRTCRSKTPSQIQALASVTLDENVAVDEKGVPQSDGIVTLLRKDHVSFLLEYYRALKQETHGKFNSDMYYLLLDLDKLIDIALADEPLLRDIVRWKIDGYTGSEIVDMAIDEHGIIHTEQYYSVVWRSRIPKLISEAAKRKWLVWHYTYEDPKSAHWKICNTCGQVKLASPYFFDRNTSNDGYYSMCKCCRSDKHKKNKTRKVG